MRKNKQGVSSYTHTQQRDHYANLHDPNNAAPPQNKSTMRIS